jgi:hypothetical protein
MDQGAAPFDTPWQQRRQITALLPNINFSNNFSNMLHFNFSAAPFVHSSAQLKNASRTVRH